MHCVIRSSCLAGAAFLVASLAESAGKVRADAITFLGLPFQQGSTLDVRGVTISSSNTVVINPVVAPNGLSTLGGIPGFSYRDGTIDSTESVTFHFDTGPVSNLVLIPQILGTIGNTSMAAEGESLITAFGPTGQFLGTVDLRPFDNPLREFDISAAFANQPISSFQFQPAGDSVNGNFATIAGLTFSPIPDTLPPAIPEPSSLIGWGLGMLMAICYASRRLAHRPTESGRRLLAPACELPTKLC
jgi:hypothetical protein